MECVVAMVHIEVEEAGRLTFWEFEKIKALFVLRGIGEWVRLVPAAVI